MQTIAENALFSASGITPVVSVDARELLELAQAWKSETELRTLAVRLAKVLKAFANQSPYSTDHQLSFRNRSNLFVQADEARAAAKALLGEIE